MVETAPNGIDGLQAAANGDYDLVVLDIMLPGTDGFAVLSALRTSKQLPLLMLSARGKTEDKVRGFDLGADDYLVKPFQFPELLARVRTLLKRGQTGAVDPVLKTADLEIDPVRHRATRGGQRIDLSAKEFALLTLLVQRSGEVLSRTQIASLVWDIHFDSDNIEELEHLSRLISDMLLIANTDAADASVRLELVDLGDEAQKIADFMNHVAEDKEVQTLSTAGTWCTLTDCWCSAQ